ncbi:hypothetical protein L3Q82_002146 [Scortum barcoo]|uniref:Uncharacterized protein n=1 Tax=Scortum barcoo TaxID=214431 RepID=A0ACB8W1X7_9TELE|nr:hypothetical protein L3Q82_002146 [Scortum barcoo]
MEVLYINSSLLFISQRPFNFTDSEKTVYEGCKDMPAVIIWYLGLQFVNMFLGIPANLMVLWLINKNKGDSSTSDIFIQNLAVLDVLFCLIPPLELANIVFLTTSSTWYVLRFFYGIKDSSPLLLSCICLDRYMAVVHPITFTELKDRRHRAVLAFVVWVITLAYARRQSGPGRDEMHPVKKRAFKMVLIILAIIVFNYFPPVALFPFQDYFSPDVFHCYIHYVAFGLMDFSSSIQPMLYLSKEKLPWSLNCCQSTTPTTE